MLRQVRQFFSGRRRWPSVCAAGVMALALSAARGDVVAHWSFDEPDASGVYPDAVGNAHAATPADRSAVSVYGGSAATPFGKAVAFNGSTGAYLTIPPLTNIQKTSLTVAVWVNLQTPQNFVLADWPSAAQAGYVFGFDPQSGDKSTAQTIVELSSAEARSRTARQWVNRLPVLRPTPQLNEWHHVAWVWDRDSQTLTTYLDEKSIGERKKPATGSSKSLDMAVNNRPVRIGSREAPNTGSSNPVTFTGAIDELWIFDQALTPVQLDKLVKYNDIAGQSAGTATVVSNPSTTTPPATPTSVAPADNTPANTAPAPDAPAATTDHATPTVGFTTPSVERNTPVTVASGRLGAGRVMGIVACLTIVVAMACYLIWAVTERGKLRAAGRL